MAKNFRELRLASKSRVLAAREFKRQIAELEKQQEKIYQKALRQLNVADTLGAFDYFYNDIVGLNSFEESLKDETLPT